MLTADDNGARQASPDEQETNRQTWGGGLGRAGGVIDLSMVLRSLTYCFTLFRSKSLCTTANFDTRYRRMQIVCQRLGIIVHLDLWVKHRGDHAIP